MARTRNLKPSFWNNEDMADLPPLTRLLFLGLTNHADKLGRLEFRPRRIKANILPYDDYDVVEALRQLVGAGFIEIYRMSEYDEWQYIQIVNFTKHQRPHHKEADSELPAPTKVRASTDLGSPTNNSLPPLTLNWVTLTLNPLTLTGSCASPSSKTPTKVRVSRAKDETAEEDKKDKDWFPEFWDCYPKKIGKKVCAGKWKKRGLDNIGQQIVADVKLKVQNDSQWLEGFSPNPETYINGDRWEDQVNVAPVKKPPAAAQSGFSETEYGEAAGFDDDMEEEIPE